MAGDGEAAGSGAGECERLGGIAIQLAGGDVAAVVGAGEFDLGAGGVGGVDGGAEGGGGGGDGEDAAAAGDEGAVGLAGGAGVEDVDVGG